MTNAGLNQKKNASPYVGTSGYQYAHWKGAFYPEDIPKSRWFEHYCRHFSIVEINNTFYHLPESATFDDWRKQAPGEFRYALKFSRYGSHLKCLKDPESTIGAFMGNAEHLGQKLGPILVQLKPNWKKNVKRLQAFLAATPRHCRWAVEFRDPSWLCTEIYDLLRTHNAALCIHDMIEDHPREITADWMYFRMHGNHYRGSYSKQVLSGLARRISKHLDAGRDVYAFFNNDEQGYATQNAMDLKRYLQPGPN